MMKTNPSTFYLFYVLYYLFDFTLWRKTLSFLFHKKLPNHTYTCLFVFVFSILMAFMKIHLYTGCWDFLVLALMYFVYLLFAIYFYQCEPRKLTVCFGIFFSISVTIEWVFLLTYYILFDTKTANVLNAGFPDLIITFTVKIAEAILLFYIAKKRKTMELPKSNAVIIWMCLCVIFIAVKTIFCFSGRYANRFYNTYALLMTLITLSAALYAITGEITQAKQEKKAKNTIDFITAQLKMTENHEQIIHDIGRQLVTFRTLVKNNKNEQVLECLNELIQTWDTDNLCTIENTLLAVILYQRKLAAHDKNILLHMKLEVTDLILPADALNGIIGNMLDNAIKACEKVKKQSERKINFEIYIQNENVIINCQNSYEEEHFLIKSHVLVSKMEKRNHDCGINAIYYYTVLNNGKANVQFGKSLFLFTVEFDKEVAIY